MIHLSIDSRWELTLLGLFVRCVERRAEYFACCLLRSMWSSSCWMCVLNSCPFKDTWQIGHCGFCKSYVDDRHRFSRETNKRCFFLLLSSKLFHTFLRQTKRKTIEIDEATRQRELSVPSGILFRLISRLLVKSLIILWLLFHLWITIRPYVKIASSVEID